MTPPTRRLLGWLPALAWVALIFVLSSQPSVPNPSQLNDKQAHAIAYAVLALLCLMGLTTWRWHSVAGASLLVAFLLSVAYGVVDEVHQSFVPGRSPDVADVLADAAGAGLALAAAGAWAILVERRSSSPRL